MASTDDWKLPWEGHCRCGRVSYRVTAPPLMSMACHCTGCQRLAASAFSLTVMVPAAGFAVEGELSVGALHGPSKFMYCSHCLTWMYTLPEGGDGLVNLRALTLDDSRWFEPFIETFTSERLPWASTPARHGFATFPEMSQYDALMADFAANAKRPA